MFFLVLAYLGCPGQMTVKWLLLLLLLFKCEEARILHVDKKCCYFLFRTVFVVYVLLCMLFISSDRFFLKQLEEERIEELANTGLS